MTDACTIDNSEQPQSASVSETGYASCVRALISLDNAGKFNEFHPKYPITAENERSAGTYHYGDYKPDLGSPVVFRLYPRSVSGSDPLFLYKSGSLFSFDQLAAILRKIDPNIMVDSHMATEYDKRLAWKDSWALWLKSKLSWFRLGQ